MSDFIERAALFTRAAHQAIGQARKYTGEPYWHHHAAVAAMVQEVEGATEEMVAAAYLHDVVEDTRVTLDDISREFGLVVSGYVYELTDQFTSSAIGNWAHRKELERQRLAAVSPGAATIKYADLIDNTPSIVAHDPGFARVYLREVRSLLHVMAQGDRGLWRKAWAVMARSEVKVGI
jgi:(p)ppGpp synthase/HD superfamily hydrolase